MIFWGTAEECIFIDEKKESSIGANELGFMGMHLDRNNADLSALLKASLEDFYKERKCA